MSAEATLIVGDPPAGEIADAGDGLRKVHTWRSLTAFGVGGIIGAGIFFMAGMAASVAGPAIMVSFLIAGGIL